MVITQYIYRLKLNKVMRCLDYYFFFQLLLIAVLHIAKFNIFKQYTAIITAIIHSFYLLGDIRVWYEPHEGWVRTWSTQQWNLQHCGHSSKCVWVSVFVCACWLILITSWCCSDFAVIGGCAREPGIIPPLHSLAHCHMISLSLFFCGDLHSPAFTKRLSPMA